MSVFERNRTVAALRGERWRANLVRGKMESQFFPSAMKVLRVKKLMSQYEMAKLCNSSIANLGGIERGTRTVKPRLAERIAAILEAPVEKLFKKDSKGKLFAICPKKS